MDPSAVRTRPALGHAFDTSIPSHEVSIERKPPAPSDPGIPDARSRRACPTNFRLTVANYDYLPKRVLNELRMRLGGRFLGQQETVNRGPSHLQGTRYFPDRGTSSVHFPGTRPVKDDSLPA